MGIRTLTDPEEGMSVLYCSVSGLAFGPVFSEPETADDFLDWALEQGGPDMRTLPPKELEDAVRSWRHLLANA